MLRHLRLILLFARVSIQDSAAYRMDFVANLLVTLASFAAELVGLWTIFSNTLAQRWGVFDMVALTGACSG